MEESSHKRFKSDRPSISEKKDEPKKEMKLYENDAEECKLVLRFLRERCAVIPRNWEENCAIHSYYANLINITATGLSKIEGKVYRKSRKISTTFRMPGLETCRAEILITGGLVIFVDEPGKPSVRVSKKDTKFKEYKKTFRQGLLHTLTTKPEMLGVIEEIMDRLRWS